MRKLAACAVPIVALAIWIRVGPIPPELLDMRRFASTTVVDRYGSVLYETLSASGNRSEWMHAEDLPENVVAATVAAEDQRYFQHPGVDPIAMVRAALHNVTSGRVVEGGSTLTQQAAKQLLASSDRSVRQKIRETVLALRLEHRYSKRAILALYLNLAPYGNQIRGLSRASRQYFGCSPDDLTIAQSAFLASLPQRPSAFNPQRDPKRARTRQLQVLARMNAPAFARNEKLVFRKNDRDLIAQHFVERVLSLHCPSPRLRGEGLGVAPHPPFGHLLPASGEKGDRVIRTTLDSNLQRTVAGILAAQRETLKRHGASAVAVAVLDNITGEWLAWEGSGDYFGESIDGVVTPRQPGSTLKPFTYAVAFEQGFTPATVLADIPSHFPTAEKGVIYTPRNYDGRFRGPLRARMALAGSENVPAVALLSKIGPPALLHFLRNTAFTDLIHTADYYGLGLTLGDAEVTLEQLITAYAALARGGIAIAPSEKRVLSQRTAFWITDILSDSRAREYIFGSGGSLDFPFPVAVKTGTSQAYRDNWTIGYTREVTVGVWVGNFDRRELKNSSGVTGAAPIFHQVMLAAKKRVGGDATIVPQPDDLERVTICTLSGLRPSPWCPSTDQEWLPKNGETKFCSWHHNGRVDWPDEYEHWANEKLLPFSPQRGEKVAEGRMRGPDQRPSPPLRGPSPRKRGEGQLRIVNPPDGATYLIDPTLRMAYQTLRLRATGAEQIRWRINDQTTNTEWPLAPGKHTITAIDDRGRKDSVTIWVK